MSASTEPLNPAATALDVQTARARILSAVSAVPQTEKVPLALALGRALAASVASPVDVPAHDNAAMDGYALRGTDLCRDGDTCLPVAGVALAGKPLAAAVPAGHAVRIMTGAIMPDGLDTVVMQEVCSVQGTTVRIAAGQQSGQNRRLRAEELRAGQPALPAGQRLRPADIGLLASLGIPAVPVRRRVRVAILSTGNELRQPGESLTAGQIHDSNRFTLNAMLVRLGVDVIDLGALPDDPVKLSVALRDASVAADMVIASGGMGVGDADFTRQMMAQLGQVSFWRIAMRPGRPLAFGRVGNALFFGLPGNPVAVMISFYFFAREALLALMGCRPEPLPTLPVRCADRVAKKPGRTEFLRGRVERESQGWVVRLTGDQGSAMLTSMSQANCLLVLEHQRGDVAAGDWVEVLMLEGLG